MYVSRSRISATVETWQAGNWNSANAVATAEAVERSVGFSSNQIPADAAISFGMGEVESGSCLQNAGFESVIG